MVIYQLFSKEKDFLKYHYYVEGFLQSEPGIIEVDLKEQKIEIAKDAQYEGSKHIYGNHAIYKLTEQIFIDNEIPEKGTVIWY